MTKLQWIERYDVRSDQRREGWAMIVIDSSGFLGVVSDFGNYAFHWRDFGCDGDFKRFLAQLDWDYLHGKLLFGREPYVYDAAETRKAVLEAIDQQQADIDVDDEHDRLEDHDLYEEEGFYEWASETRLDSPYELSRKMHEPQCRRFCQEVWPRFVALMKDGAAVPVDPPKEGR